MAEDLPPLPSDAPWWARWLFPWLGRQWADLCAQVKRYGPALAAAICEAYAENAETIDAWAKARVPEHTMAHLLAGAFVIRIVWQALKRKAEQ